MQPFLSPRRTRGMLITGLMAATTIALAGCASPAESTTQDDGLVKVVASTDVYGDIAQTIGGDQVEVTSIISDPAQDPHSFEADARVQLALSRADVVIENGGGYDDFVDTMLSGAKNPDVTLINAVDVSGLDTADDTGDGEFNEHVFYSLDAMRALSQRLVDEFSAQAPDAASAFKANATTFEAELTTLQQQAGVVEKGFAGTAVAATEPVAGYLLDAMGLTNVTPPEFSEAVEAETDVAPNVLQETLKLFSDGSAELLIYNEQTPTPQSEQVRKAAEAAGAGVVGVTETLPDGENYETWMTATIESVRQALEK